MKYCNHLFDNTTNGYIQLIYINNKKKLKVYNTQIKALKTIVEETEGKEDVYISSNTYYKPKRLSSNIRQFRALYIDIDLKQCGKNEAVYKIYELVEKEKIPMPSMIVDSGRGIHLYWRVKNAPYGAMWTWQELEDYLYNHLKQLGADIQATDSARVLRLPKTINSRNNQECRILVINDDIEYSMYDLREKYLNYKIKKGYQLEFEQSKKKDKCIVNNLFNSYTLHLNRIHDIKTLCKLRNYDLKGYRNFILHCYAYWEGIYTRDSEELIKKVIELNNSFKEPLKEIEVRAILRSIPKAIQKFIEYEQGIRSGQVKRVSKGMKDKGGYWYRNITLIERLDIILEEQKHMKTIIGKEEKYSRNNKRRKTNRRNEKGLTKREQQKQERINKILELKNKGLNQSKIAVELGISRQAVSKLLKHI
ncbi:DNA-binding response regulator [Clostridium botulinum C/D]|nr:DNA-binding response regulator [Clostridium botulinum C/D]